MARAVVKPKAAPARVRVAAGYSGTPLPKKLGIRPDTTVVLIDAPDGFARTLAPLPQGVRLRTTARGAADVVLWFVAARVAYARGLHSWARRTDWRALWIAWPKKASGIQSDLGEATVRQYGLAAGLVDYKICALDATWSGLCFARRKEGGACPSAPPFRLE